MHQALEDIRQELTALSKYVESVIPNDEPLGISHANWRTPVITRAELLGELASIERLIAKCGVDDLGAHEPLIRDYVRRLKHLHTTAQYLWGNSDEAVPAFLISLMGLRNALKPLFSDEAREVEKLRKLVAQVRTLEASLKRLEPRTTSLTQMVDRIEAAYTAADRLPADLADLEEARVEIAKTLKESNSTHNSLKAIFNHSVLVSNALEKDKATAESVLKECQTAYAAATSVGLAAAFSERSTALAKSMWIWVVGLIVALVGGSHLGSSRLDALTKLLEKPNASDSVIVLNVMLVFLSIAAPVWFAWLATKQVGQRFRLSEDYAFKASVSRAYEGFRKEAARFDEDMEAQLLASALSRFDEQPLRLVEPATHGSPWHELASSEAVKRAVKTVPDFVAQVKDLAAKGMAKVTDKAGQEPSA